MNHVIPRSNRHSTLPAQHLRDMGVDIPDVTVDAAKLSGGQRQAIAVARSVYSDAHLLLLDEPLAAIGAKEATIILDLVSVTAETSVAELTELMVAGYRRRRSS